MAEFQFEAIRAITASLITIAIVPAWLVAMSANERPADSGRAKSDGASRAKRASRFR